MSSVWVEQPVQDQMKRTYYYDDGTCLTKEGGTVAWRNNNEGNLRPGELSASRIGVDKKDFAIFATPEDGKAAKRYLLFSSKSYRDLFLKKAINKYAPAKDNNDPVKYANFVMKRGNVSDKVMSTYTDDEQVRIMEAMKVQEGYKAGTEKRGTTDKKKPTNTYTVKLNYNVDSAVKYNKKLSYSKKEWQSIQNKLNDSLPKEKKITADGIPGKLTADAVYNFQSAKGLEADGKFGSNTSKTLGVAQSNKSNNTQQKQTTQTQKTGSVKIPSGATIMSSNYTPDLDLLNKHATEKGFNVSNVGTAANYVAKYCTGDNSQHQCTRGTSLFLQLASYARGEAKRTYASSCAAHLFGSANALTNYNISSSVAGEFSKKVADSKVGKEAMNTHISNNLNKNGEFVTFKYASSQHIVFYSNGGWYSDFKQGTPTGCGGSKTNYSNVHFFKL